MTLRDLLRVLAGDGLSRTGAPPSAGDAALDRAWSGLAYDSRRVSAGDVFVAIKGERHDGADFADSAIAGGATAIVSERAAPEPAPAPWIQVSDARLALAVLSSWHFGHPSRDLLVVGITGTNGKTTASYLVRAILERAGYPCGLIGTVQYSIGAELLEAPRTTPEWSRHFEQLLGELSAPADAQAAAILAAETKAAGLRSRLLMRKAELAIDANLAADLAWQVHQMQKLPADQIAWACGLWNAARQSGRTIEVLENRLRRSKTLDKEELKELATAYRHANRPIDAQRADTTPPPTPPQQPGQAQPMPGGFGMGGMGGQGMF